MHQSRLPFELLRENLVIRLRNRLFFTVGDFVYAGNNIVSPGEFRL